jgi:hypothetical protein
MADKLIHSQSGFKPKIMPRESTVLESNIDRAQNLDPDVTLNYQEVEELGREGLVSTVHMDNTVSCRLTQFEYGNIDLFRRLGNKSPAVDTLTLADFEGSAFDIAAYVQDTDGDAYGTVWYEEQRLAGFSINIPSPTDVIERSFDFAGEKGKLLKGDNKYLVAFTVTVGSDDAGSLDLVFGAGDLTNYPNPVLDPKNAGVYILKGYRIRAGVTTDLGNNLAGNGYTYTVATTTLNIADAQDGDVYKFYYSAGSYITGTSAWTANDSDLPCILGHSARVYLGTANRLYRLQDCNIDVRLTRADYKEIGNKNVVQRGVDDKEVSVTLGRILQDYTIEDLMSTGADDDIIDLEDLGNGFTLIVALYSDETHTTFKMGYKATGLYPSNLKPSTAAVGAMVNAGDTLTGKALTITSDLSELGIS